MNAVDVVVVAAAAGTDGAVAVDGRVSCCTR